MRKTPFTFRVTSAEYDAWFREQVQAGIDDVAAGRVVPHEDVTREFAARKAAIRRKAVGN